MNRPPALPPSHPRRPPAITPRRPPTQPVTSARAAGAAPTDPATAPATASATAPDTAPLTTPLTAPSTALAPQERSHALGWRPTRPPVVSTGSAARFVERAAHERRVRRRRYGWSTAGALVVIGLGWLALGSPLFALDVADVVVTGEGAVVEPGAVREVVAAHEGTPLPRLDTVALRREVLDVPGVRAADIVRQWPHGLAVTVVAREPVAAVPAPEGDLVLLDAEGVQVGRTAGEPGLPVVGMPLDSADARVLHAVLTVLDRAPVELTGQIVAISAQSQDTVAFDLADGSRVEWGSADDVALKTEVLATLRAAEAGLGPRVFDVSAPTAPITRSF